MSDQEKLDDDGPTIAAEQALLAVGQRLDVIRQGMRPGLVSLVGLREVLALTRRLGAVIAAYVEGAPLVARDFDAMDALSADALAAGFHLSYRSPFEPDGAHSIGFTPHGTTEWNGRPDHLAARPTYDSVVIAARRLLADVVADGGANVAPLSGGGEAVCEP